MLLRGLLRKRKKFSGALDSGSASTLSAIRNAGGMGKVKALASIYWSYAFSMWEQSPSCGGAAQRSVQLGTLSSTGFSDGDLLACVSDQFRSYPGNATLLITSLDTADTFTYSTFQCGSAAAAAGGCDMSFSVGCAKLVMATGKAGVCAQLGAAGSFMLTHTVSSAFYGILFGSLGAVAAFFLYAACQRGWRLRGGRCVKVDLEAEAEAEYKAEQRRRAELQASFDRAETNGLTTRVKNPAATHAR